MVEDIGRVVELSEKSSFLFLYNKHQIHLRRMVRWRQVRDAQARKTQVDIYSVLEHQHDLGKRRLPAQVPLGVEFLDELLKRKILVLIGVQCYIPHELQQLASAGIFPHLRAQHQRVDEESR